MEIITVLDRGDGDFGRGGKMVRCLVDDEPRQGSCWAFYAPNENEWYMSYNNRHINSPDLVQKRIIIILR